METFLISFAAGFLASVSACALIVFCLAMLRPQRAQDARETDPEKTIGGFVELECSKPGPKMRIENIS